MAVAELLGALQHRLGALYDQNIAPAVCTRIAELVRWHYAQNDAPEEMLPYEKLDGVPGHR